MQYKEKLGTQIEEQEKKLQMMEKEVTTKLSNAPSICAELHGFFNVCVCVSVWCPFFFLSLQKFTLKKLTNRFILAPFIYSMSVVAGNG